MVSEEFLMIERIGVGATAFLLVYFLLKETQKKAFAQADKVLEMAESTIKENTAALNRMFECLSAHTQQKEGIITEMRECRRVREEKMKELEFMIRK